MPLNTDAYRVVPESTLRKHLHTLCYKAVMEREFSFFLFFVFYCTHGKKNNPDWIPAQTLIWS